MNRTTKLDILTNRSRKLACRMHKTDFAPNLGRHPKRESPYRLFKAALLIITAVLSSLAASNCLARPITSGAQPLPEYVSLATNQAMASNPIGHPWQQSKPPQTTTKYKPLPRPSSISWAIIVLLYLAIGLVVSAALYVTAERAPHDDEPDTNPDNTNIPPP